MATLLKDAPVLMVKDVVASAVYWRDKVGFGFNEMWGDPPDFTMVHRDRLTVFLAKPDRPGTPITPNWKVKDKMWNIYFWVDDARALYEELQERGATIDYTLHEKPYGSLEFGIQDLDGHDIAFGQNIGTAR